MELKNNPDKNKVLICNKSCYGIYSELPGNKKRNERLGFQTPNLQ